MLHSSWNLYGCLITLFDFVGQALAAKVSSATTSSALLLALAIVASACDSL